MNKKIVAEKLYKTQGISKKEIPNQKLFDEYLNREEEMFKQLFLQQENRLKEMFNLQASTLEDTPNLNREVRTRNAYLVSRYIANEDGKISIVRELSNGELKEQYIRKIKDKTFSILPDRIGLRDKVLIQTTKKYIKGYIQSIFCSNKEFYLTIGLSNGEVRRIKLSDILLLNKF